jgi:hypothetical protein
LRGILSMVGRLARNVQLRKESWGLLFYSQPQHKVCFVRSGDWLYPQYFDGTWTFDGLVGDIARRTGAPAELIERSIQKVTKHLMGNGLIVNEPR